MHRRYVAIIPKLYIQPRHVVCATRGKGVIAQQAIYLSCSLDSEAMSLCLKSLKKAGNEYTIDTDISKSKPSR